MKISFVAVLAGGVIDIFLTNVFSMPLGYWVASHHDFSQVPQEQVSGAFTNVIQGSPALYAISLLSGISGSILAGFLSALIARRHELLNGALASWLCLFFGFQGLNNPDGDPLLTKLVLMALSVAACLFGGWLRLRTKKSPALA